MGGTCAEHHGSLLVTTYSQYRVHTVPTTIHPPSGQLNIITNAQHFTRTQLPVRLSWHFVIEPWGWAFRNTNQFDPALCPRA